MFIVDDHCHIIEEVRREGTRKASNTTLADTLHRSRDLNSLLLWHIDKQV